MFSLFKINTTRPLFVSTKLFGHLKYTLKAKVSNGYTIS